MPNNDDDLSRRLAVVEQTFGLRTVDNNAVANPNPNDITANHVDNINWKALYKVLEAEVESVILDPNAPQYVKNLFSRIMSRLQERLPR